MDKFYTNMSKYNDDGDVESKHIAKASTKEAQKRGVVTGVMQKLWTNANYEHNIVIGSRNVIIEKNESCKIPMM